MKRIIAVFLALIFVLPGFYGCKKDDDPDAVIILPGIMGSEMCLEKDTIYGKKQYEAGTVLWLTIDSVKKVFAVPEHIEMLDYDSGCSVRAVDHIVNDYNVNRVYGSFNTYAKLYSTLYYEYRDICDVVLYNYDWREDPYDTAAELDAYITEKGYENVIIVAHSMGGLVASHYFAKGEAQRAKVHTYLSLGTPYLGAEQAAYVMVTGNINNFFANLLVSDAVLEIAPTLDSMYALLPYRHLGRTYLSTYSISGKTYSDSFDSDNELLSKYVDGYDIERRNIAEGRKSLLFDETGRHVTELVNSYYLVGDGESTVTGVDLPKKDILPDVLCSVTKTDTGDGTVSLYSATAGGTLKAERTFIKRSVGDRSAKHDSLAGVDDETNLDFVLAVLNGEIDTMSDFDLKSRYNIEKASSIN